MVLPPFSLILRTHSSYLLRLSSSLPPHPSSFSSLLPPHSLPSSSSPPSCSYRSRFREGAAPVLLPPPSCRHRGVQTRSPSLRHSATSPPLPPPLPPLLASSHCSHQPQASWGWAWEGGRALAPRPPALVGRGRPVAGPRGAGVPSQPLRSSSPPLTTAARTPPLPATSRTLVSVKR